MTRKFLQLGLALLLLGFSSCAMVDAVKEGPAGEDWETWGKGTTTVGLSSGWAFYQGKATASGQSGVLEGDLGSDTAGLRPLYGAALTVRHMVTDHISLGGILEVRSFDPETLKPLSAVLRANEFQTIHYIFSSRYFFNGIGESKRFRPFVGLDLSYVPEVDLGNVKVTYPNGIPVEYVNVVGSSYWSIAGVLGLSYQLTDNWSFDSGAFYEYALETSNSTVAFQNIGGAEAELALRPQGLIIFGGLTYAF